MKPTRLVLRGYAVLEDNIWSAVCVDLTLAAQGDTFEEAMEKLKAQVGDYINDAREGEDKAHGAQLLRRKAPLNLMAKYYYIKVVYYVRKKLHSLRDSQQPRLCNDILSHLA